MHATSPPHTDLQPDATASAARTEPAHPRIDPSERPWYIQPSRTNVIRAPGSHVWPRHRHRDSLIPRRPAIQKSRHVADRPVDAPTGSAHDAGAPSRAPGTSPAMSGCSVTDALAIATAAPSRLLRWSRRSLSSPKAARVDGTANPFQHMLAGDSGSGDGCKGTMRTCFVACHGDLPASASSTEFPTPNETEGLGPDMQAPAGVRQVHFADKQCAIFKSSNSSKETLTACSAADQMLCCWLPHDCKVLHSISNRCTQYSAQRLCSFLNVPRAADL